MPAHAHADTLSFELTYKNQRVFVNGGTSTYEISDKRLRERSTSNHNTVVLNDCNSSDVWGSFRTGRRAKPINLNVKHFKDSITISCAHDGYTFLPGRPIHYREWYINNNKLFELIYIDHLINLRYVTDYRKRKYQQQKTQKGI